MDWGVRGPGGDAQVDHDLIYACVDHAKHRQGLKKGT